MPRFPDKTVRNMKDLLARFGDIPPERVRMHPLPGTATERDLLRVLDRENVPCELLDGTLVEKPMGAKESMLAGRLIRVLGDYVYANNLGEVGAPDLTLRVMQDFVRLPDVAFISREQLPGGELPADPIPDLVPELVVEILSSSNTPQEMLRKREEFFLSGTKLFWIVDPNKRTVDVYTAPDRRVTLTERDELSGGDVLPGFKTRLSDLFARVPHTTARSPKRKKP